MAILAEDQVRGLLPFDGRDLLAELEVSHTRLGGITGERAAGAGPLS
jgi:hypothetical protein